MNLSADETTFSQKDTFLGFYVDKHIQMFELRSPAAPLVLVTTVKHYPGMLL